MPKNNLIMRQNYSSKNYYFNSFSHFIFQNASSLHLEITLSHLSSAQSINKQKTLNRSRQLQS